MFSKETPIGQIFVSNEYFSKLIGSAVSSCYGVSGMIPQGRQRLFAAFGRSGLDKGVLVKGNLQSIDVTVTITVTYGVNISAISDSIIHKIKFTVYQATGITVNKVTIRVAKIKTE